MLLYEALIITDYNYFFSANKEARFIILFVYQNNVLYEIRETNFCIIF